MNTHYQARFESLYSTYITELKLQDKSDKTIACYARCLRQAAIFFDTCPDNYLYREVINEQNIIENQHGNVTFRYRDSATKQDKYITEPGYDFLWRVIQHVPPKGFQRTRNCGFLHGNAKQTLQLLLKMQLPPLLNTAKADA